MEDKTLDPKVENKITDWFFIFRQRGIRGLKIKPLVVKSKERKLMDLKFNKEAPKKIPKIIYQKTWVFKPRMKQEKFINREVR